MVFGITEGAVSAQVFEVHGDIDLATAHALGVRLLDAIATGPRFLIVDLEDAGFIDARALPVLLSAQRRLQATGGKLSMVCADPSVRRIFEIMGLTDVLNLSGARREALSGAQELASTS